MPAHFTVFGGAFVHEARGFSAPRRRSIGGLTVWGFVLASLLFGVTTVASVTAQAWTQSGVLY